MMIPVDWIFMRSSRKKTASIKARRQIRQRLLDAGEKTRAKARRKAVLAALLAAEDMREARSEMDDHE